MANSYYDNSDAGQRFQPGTTVEAADVDGKFDSVQAGFDGVETDTKRSIKLPDEGDSKALTENATQRRNKVVGFDADGNLVLTGGFTYRGDWATATEYYVNDVFRDATSRNLYVVKEKHTSGTLADDITAGKNELAISVAEVEQFKTDAEAAANTATTKASEALASAANAEDSAIATAARYDSFDDRYLGAKALNPATDNDGDPLVVGALYFNSTSKTMRQWTGSVWDDSFATVDLEGNATGPIDMAGHSLTVDAVYSDQVDKGTQSTASATVTFAVSAASSQKITINADTTFAFSNWPASGTQGGVEIELVNGGSAAITFPTINWFLGDGTTSTTFADMGVTLAASGTNTLSVWSSDGGTTLYGVAV